MVLNVGIAGFGVVGQRRAKCIKNNKHLRLTAVCDKNNEFELEKNIKYFSNFKDLLNSNIQVLFVCMTNDMASQVVIAALKKGFHVFCEKPPGRNIKEIQDVILEEQKHPNLKLMYGFNHRFHNSIIDALNITRSKSLGNIINLRGIYGKSKLITFNQPDWRTKRSIAGGGVLLDQGIHMVDLMRLFAGEFNEVKSFVSNKHWNYDVEDNVYAILKSEKNIFATLNSSATQWKHKFSLEINFEKGNILLEGILSSSKSYGEETLTVLNLNLDEDSSEYIKKYDYDPSWEKEIDLFTDAIINNKKIETSNSLDALNTLKLVYKIYYADTKWRKEFEIENPETY